MGEAFLEARLIWLGEADAQQKTMSELIKKLLEDPQSVWNTVDWNIAFDN